MILGMFFIIVSFNSFFLIRQSIFISNRILLCMQIIKDLTNVFIPYLIMTILNFIVIMRLRKQRHKSNVSQSQHIQANRTNKSWRFTRNTILIDLIYLIFNFTSTIYEIHSSYLNINNMPVDQFPTSFSLFFRMFSLLPYIYSSCLFILFISFNKIFRGEFTALINQQRFFVFVKNLFCFYFV